MKKLLVIIASIICLSTAQAQPFSSETITLGMTKQQFIAHMEQITDRYTEVDWGVIIGSNGVEQHVYKTYFDTPAGTDWYLYVFVDGKCTQIKVDPAMESNYNQFVANYPSEVKNNNTYYNIGDYKIVPKGNVFYFVK